MADTDTTEYSDTLQDDVAGAEPKSSARVLAAIRKAQDTFRDYQDTCRRIDDVYSKVSVESGDWLDPDYDLFWSSMEILKPAIYAHAPVPAVAPMFSDRRPLYNTTAELLERVTTADFDRSNIDQAMLSLRDDLAFTNRGQLWVTYESDDEGGGQRACIDHLDRTDFLHEPARSWAEVGWVARRAWMTKTEMRKRFLKTSGNAYQRAKTEIRRDDKDNGGADDSKKAGVWEVWHQRDNKVYWVADGVDVLLDSDPPHLTLSEFFPCPRPAYGTLRRRSLVPVPDYVRYAPHLSKISTLTARIYLLLDKIKLKGLVPAGGDIGDAIQAALRSDDDEIIIPVPGAALVQGASGFVTWMPLADIATAIQGLIAARTQLFNDFYQLSGISDIMRGATEAEETLGAQQLKSQYGSVRVRDKIDELQRVARDVARIVAEIASDKFTQKTLLDMSMMEIPTKSDVSNKIKGIEETAKQELQALQRKAKDMAAQAMQGQQQAPQPGQPPMPPGQAPQGQQVDPQAAAQQFQQAQQAILAKYAPQLKAAEETVVIEDVMTLLRDDRARGFAFEIATDSTIMTDEVAEKAARNEFLGAVANSVQSLTGLASMGEAGAALAGGFLKFVTAPYRVGRELNTLIDDFVDAAPQMAAQMAGQQGGGQDQALADANNKLAQAEQTKAQAAVMTAQSRAQIAQADNERKIAEVQAKAINDKAKADQENAKLQLQVSQMQQDAQMAQAQIDNLTAQTAKILASIGLDERKQQLSEYTAANAAQTKEVDQAMAAQGLQQKAVDSQHSRQMGERQQTFTEQNTERQQTFAEKQAAQQAKEPANA